MNNDLKLIALYDKINGKIRELKEELSLVEKQEGPMGPQGLQGPKGEKGDTGRDGVNGKDGRNGVDGKDGIDGADGTSITDVELDFDNHLRVTLSNGTVLDAGEINIPEGLSSEQVQNVIHHTGGSSTVPKTWVDYAYNWSEEPVSLGAVTGGEKYQYTFTDATLYRFVPDPYVVTDDSFYNDIDLTQKVVSRGGSI